MQIAGTKFNQTLAYNAAGNGVTPSKALYNGNVSAMKWKSGDETMERGYQFSYDNMDRLTDAAYGEGASHCTGTPMRRTITGTIRPTGSTPATGYTTLTDIHTPTGASAPPSAGTSPSTTKPDIRSVRVNYRAEKGIIIDAMKNAPRDKIK